jgi:hypothetical protein
MDSFIRLAMKSDNTAPFQEKASETHGIRWRITKLKTLAQQQTITSKIICLTKLEGHRPKRNMCHRRISGKEVLMQCISA